MNVPRIAQAFVLGIAVTTLSHGNISSAASTAAGNETRSTAMAERSAPHILVGAGDVHASCADLLEYAPRLNCLPILPARSSPMGTLHLRMQA